MIGYWGEVVGIIDETESIQFIDVLLFQSEQKIKVIHYVYGENRCHIGQQVQVNMSAIDLQLGTGGYGFVMSLIANQEQASVPGYSYPGHIMKLRYTPHQTPILAVESPESEHHPLFQSSFSLEGKKIFLGELHSMLPILASLLQSWDSKRKMVYIMDDQAALNIALSHHVRYLQKKINLVTITYGQALGGDMEAVNLYTALEAAVKVAEADDIMITQGPGVAGTGTQRGFSGMQIVHWLHAVHSCGGESIVIPRIQLGDKRPRHHGLSHHTIEPLKNHALVPALLPFPSLESVEVMHQKNSIDVLLKKQFMTLEHQHKLYPIYINHFQKELEEALRWYERPIKTMGRSYFDDPYFFYAVGAAFYLYKTLLNQKVETIIGENENHEKPY
jgi:hypothetical protein